MPKKKSAPRPTDSHPESQPGGETPDFEQAMEELSAIVNRLEQGEGSLENALEDYSVAIGLMKICRQKLDRAERRVAILSGVDADGNPLAEPVEDLEQDLDTRRQSRGARRSAKQGKPGTAEPDRSDAELF